MAASAAGARGARRGPAPIASFDHDGSDESSPEGRARLPDIREAGAGERLAAGEPRARSHSTPAAALPAPRIDISRASSSSHHDSRDSSPELALFAGAAAGTLDLGFREDGALDLRSSTEELAFLEPAPAEAAARPPPAPPAPPAPPPERRHSRKDSQSSEAALLAVSGRTSRLSSVGSQCSALSRVSRLSVVSGASRSPSPHRMLLETSFCGPKPIEADPEISAAALVGRILGLAEAAPAPAEPPAPPALDARDRREVRTEATVESARPGPLAPAPPVPAPDEPGDAGGEERRARPRIRREPSEPEVYKPRNKAKDVIRIKLRPDDSCEEEEEAARKPDSLALGHAARPADPAPAPLSPSPSRRRSPSPAPAAASRKSSFCSLFKSRETIASPESPSEALRRKRSLTEGRSRSKSRDRSQTPTSAKIRGSVLSLFRTPRRSATSPAGASREGSPGARPAPAAPRADRLKYYEDNKDGIIHIPLRTPPDERPRRNSGAEPGPAPDAAREPRPASAPQPRAMPDPPPEPAAPRPASARPPAKPVQRTVLPDGSIIIPLHSPTETRPEPAFAASASPPPAQPPQEVVRPVEAPRPAAAACPPRSAAAGEQHPAQRSSRSGDGGEAAPQPAGGAPSPAAAAEAGGEADARRRRKERLVFTTHVGSREQVFSTQFSITKTPSVTSEISGSFPSFEGETPALRDSHIAASPAPASPPAAASPAGAPRDSSESEASSEAGAECAGNEVEKRVLVVQHESFEEELPYVPTTLPQERSVALPMVPVRERGDVRVWSTQRPRAAAPPARAPPPPPGPAPAAGDKLRIKLPRRPRAAAPAPRPRALGGGEPAQAGPAGEGGEGGESRAKPEWIDFSEVPERRKQPKRIQTLPAAAAGGVMFSYVEPEQCRCECHAHQDAGSGAEAGPAPGEPPGASADAAS